MNSLHRKMMVIFIKLLMVNGKKIEAMGNVKKIQASILCGFVVIKVMVDVCKTTWQW